VELDREYKCLKDQIFSDGRFSIRSIKDSDIQQIRTWRNAQIDVLRQTKLITEFEQCEYFSANIWPEMKVDQPDNVLMAFMFEGNLVGYGGLVHISWDNRRAEISFLLDPNCIGNNEEYAKYFSAFLRLIKRLAFNELDFNRIFTETFEYRIAHMNVLESEGFLLEGIMRKHIIIGNKSISSIIHGYIK